MSTQVILFKHTTPYQLLPSRHAWIRLVLGMHHPSRRRLVYAQTKIVAARWGEEFTKLSNLACVLGFLALGGTDVQDSVVLHVNPMHRDLRLIIVWGTLLWIYP